MTEAEVKKEIKRRLDAAGAWYFMPVPMGYGRRGIPDFIVCRNGRFVAIEAKAPGGKVTPWQKRELSAIVASCGVELVVDGSDASYDLLDALLSAA